MGIEGIGGEGGGGVGGKGGGGGRGEKWPKPCMHIWIIIKKRKWKKKNLPSKSDPGPSRYTAKLLKFKRRNNTYNFQFSTN
jgi:hypothetical protein